MYEERAGRASSLFFCLIKLRQPFFPTLQSPCVLPRYEVGAHRFIGSRAMWGRDGPDVRRRRLSTLTRVHPALDSKVLVA